jgi:antitoxin VapB
MHISKVFVSGKSQAVRIPKEFQIDEKEVYIQKVGKSLVLFPKDDPWTLFEQSLSKFTDDVFEDGRNQPEMQIREEL